MLKKQVHSFMTAWRSPRWRWALLIAALSDALGFAVLLFPPAQWLLDAITAVALLMILGVRWPLFTALAVAWLRQIRSDPPSALTHGLRLITGRLIFTEKLGRFDLQSLLLHKRRNLLL